MPNGIRPISKNGNSVSHVHDPFVRNLVLHDWIDWRTIENNSKNRNGCISVSLMDFAHHCHGYSLTKSVNIFVHIIDFHCACAYDLVYIGELALRTSVQSKGSYIRE